MEIKALFPECEIEIRSVLPDDKTDALFTAVKTKLRNSDGEF